MGNQSVQILQVRAFNAKVTSADVVDGLIVDHETAVRVLQSGVGGQNRIVRLDDGGGHLRRGIHAELKFALLAVVDRETLHEQGTKARAGTTAEGVEDKEALKATAVVCHAANLVENLINELLADGVVATSIVVGRILFPCDHLLWVEKASVCASADFVDDIGLEIAVDGSGDIFAVACPKLSARENPTEPSRSTKIVPVSEKKVLNPWSGSAAFRSSVRYPSGWEVYGQSTDEASE